MRKETKNLFRFLCFALAFLIIFSAIADLFTPKGDEWSNFRGFYSEERDSLDVIYIGASVCITSWMPYEAWHSSGITSYAFGKSSLMSFAYKPIIKEALRYQKPQLLIIDVRPLVYTYLEDDNRDEVFSTVSLINCLRPYSIERIPLAEKAYGIYKENIKTGGETGNESFASMLIDIIRYHGNWIVFNKSYIYDHQSDLPQNYSKGFLEVPQYSNQSLSGNSGVSISVPVNSRAEAELIELLDYLNDTGLNALFVVTPYNESGDDKAQYNYLSDIIESRGFSFVDFNDFNAEIGIDGGTDFYNENHMNVFGAEKYTAYLTEYLLANYSINTDHDDEVDYAWSSGYGLWAEKKSALEQKVTAMINSADNPDGGAATEGDNGE